MKPYEKPEIDVIVFITKDVITASGEGNINLPDY